MTIDLGSAVSEIKGGGNISETAEPKIKKIKLEIIDIYRIQYRLQYNLYEFYRVKITCYGRFLDFDDSRAYHYRSLSYGLYGCYPLGNPKN